MRRIALKNKVGIILLGGGLILAALGAALFCGSAGAGISAEAAVGGETMTGVCPGCGKHGATYRVMSQATCTTGLRQSISHAECGYFGSTEGDPLGHDYGEYIETTAPTCTEAGVETAECSRCGDTTTRTGDAALGHTPGATATCTEDQTCTVCGAELTPALGHDWKDEMSYDETMHWTGCSRCDAKYENTIGIPDDKLKHTPGPAATCTDAQTCTVCGMEITAALGHDPVTDAAVDPTCTTTGLTAGSHCARCDEVLQAQEELPALGHDYGEYVETTAPTCTKDGEETSSCSRCGDTKTQTIAALKHDYYSTSVYGDSTYCKDEKFQCTRCSAYYYSSTGTTSRRNHSLSKFIYGYPSCTGEGLAKYACSYCNYSYTVSISALGHDWGAYIQTTAPTCTKDGEETSSCSRCSDVRTRAVDALGHDPEGDNISATCTSSGTSGRTVCSRCGVVVNSGTTVPALGHSYGSYTTVTPATCTLGGTERAACTRCGDTTTRSTSALGHSWGAYIQTTAPTCTKDGEETSTCSRCGDVRTRAVDALGHDPVTDAAVYPTCTATGLTAGSHCARCDAVLQAQEEIPALGHDYGEYVETKAPTCTEAGIETAECSRCGDTKTQAIPAIGHKLGPDATCTEDQTCTVCGAVISSAGGHIPGLEATCTEAQICTVCGTELAPALGHDPVTDAAVDPTCTATGLTAGSHCARCDTVLEAQEELPALGHDWGEYVETKAPTCTEAGIETATCSRCGDAKTQAIPATGHKLGPDATCTEDQTCTVCGAVISAAGGHTPGPAATCTDAQTCTVCGTELAPALGHDPVTDAAVDPTCTETGLTAGSHCARCDTVLEAQEGLPAFGHDWGEYVETKAPTCTAAGEETAECSRCGDTKTQAIPATGHKAAPGATCTEDQTCTVCGAVIAAAGEHTPGAEATCTEGQTCTVCGTEIVPALGHDMTYVPGVDATETEDGSREHWDCGTCGKHFADEAGAEEITEDELRIPAGSGDLDGADPADPGDNDEAGGLDAATIILIIACTALGIGIILAIVIAAKDRRRRR